MPTVCMYFPIYVVEIHVYMPTVCMYAHMLKN